MRRSLAGIAFCLCIAPFLLAGEGSASWLDVPFVKQEKNGCGAASIAMVMQYWDRELGRVSPAVDVDAVAIQRRLYSPASRGIWAADLERYLQDHGYRTFAYQGTWDDLQQQVAKGRPPIVALKVGGGDLHYVVVTGLDSGQNVLLKNDPAQRKLLKQSRASFEKEWKAATSWMLLAVPLQEGAVAQVSLR